MVYHRKVVADEHVGNAELLLQILHQVQYLGLYRYIQRTHGLIGHDQARPGDKCTRNGNALALSARKFMGVLAQVVGAQTDLGQHLGRLLALFGLVRVALCLQGLGDDAFHRLARIERAIGVLEHHLEIASCLAQLRRGQLVQVASQQVHGAGGGCVQRHDESRERRFARTRLADNAQAAAAGHGKAHAVECVHLAGWLKQALARQRVLAHQVGDLKQRVLRWFGGWRARRGRRKRGVVSDVHAATSTGITTWALRASAMASGRRQRTIWSPSASVATSVGAGASWWHASKV